VLSDAGAPIDLAAAYRGQVLVLDFWAGWCERCEASIPRVRRLAAAFAPHGLVVIGVNASEKPAAARQAARDFGIDYPIVLDPTFAFATAMGATGLPQVLVIDRAGAVAHRASEIDEATLAVVRRLLE
jgi:cytochrome c biogenesis protein CcmG/thiol:disulfide interchange protein DsbE